MSKVNLTGLLAGGRAMARGRATEAEKKMVWLPLGDRALLYARASVPLIRFAPRRFGVKPEHSVRYGRFLGEISHGQRTSTHNTRYVALQHRQVGRLERAAQELAAIHFRCRRQWPKENCVHCVIQRTPTHENP